MPLLLILICLQSDPRPVTDVAGVVTDPAGLAIVGAAVSALGAPEACTTVTASDGRFSLSCAPPDGRLAVRAPGFEEAVVGVADVAGGDGRVVLQPVRYSEDVVVTASRSGEITTSPAAPVTVVRSSDLALSPPQPVDDLLRSIPGFTLFRRSSSRVANPTTQGASLRGLSASGAGRTLVLADGVPLNDPFGGWAYWNRIPAAAIERVEVVRGGASDLYGADALSGVVQILTARPSGRNARVEASAGTRESGRASIYGGLAAKRWEAVAAGEAGTTEGYILVPDPDRGAVDTPAGGRYHVARLDLGYRSSGGMFLRASGDAYGERRRNGTPLQTNSTDTRQARLSAGGDLVGGRWRLLAQVGEQVYRQAFSAIADDRDSERLVRTQRVPASQHGVAMEWSGRIDSLDLLVGADTRDTAATNQEQGYLPSGQPLPPTSTPAFQRTSGAFAQASVPVGTLRFTIGARADARQRDRDEGWLSGDSAVSPRGTVTWSPDSWLVLRGSVGWSFRAPTLNERYRGFRVGNIVTLPNADLVPERLRSVEMNALASAGRRGSVRATIFRNDLSDAVTNVTLVSTPALITRQRRNVGGVRAIGLELEGEWQLSPLATLIGSAAFLDSEFVDDPGLDGFAVPQVPAWQTAVGVRGTGPWRLILAAQVRAFADQWEDDRNTLVLGGGAVADVTVIRPLGSKASAFVSVENLFDDTYDVGRTPVPTVGFPVTVHGGVRLTY